MTTLEPLVNGFAAFPYVGLTYPHYRPRFLAMTPDGTDFAVGASDDVPVGLAFAEVAEVDGERYGRVLSLSVVPARRNQAIGKHLLTALTEEFVTRGVRRVELAYPGDSPFAPALNRILDADGWEPARPSMHLFQISSASAEAMLGARWMQRESLPGGAELLPWTHVTTDERSTIHEWIAAGEVPAVLSPFQEADRIDGHTSVAARWNGTIVGWMITHRIASRTVRYTALYVRPDAPVKGLGVQLVGEAVRRHIAAESHLPDAFACWGTFADIKFLGFVQRRIFPSAGGGTQTVTLRRCKSLPE